MINNFSTNLKLIRQYFDYSQARMAELAGVSRGTYCAYENDSRNIDAVTLYELASNLEINIDLFFEKDENKLLIALSDYSSLAMQEKKLLSAFRKVSSFHQGYFLGEIECFVKLDKQQNIKIRTGR